MEKQHLHQRARGASGIHPSGSEFHQLESRALASEHRVPTGSCLALPRTVRAPESYCGHGQATQMAAWPGGSWGQG